MRINGDSIYGTTASPLREYSWGRTTVKNDTIYLHVFSWPGDHILRMSGLRNHVDGAHLLADPEHSLAVGRSNGVISVELPPKATDEMDTIVVLKISGKPEVDPTVLTQGSDAPFKLDYLTALTSGQAVKRFNRDGGFHISKWTEPTDSASWHLLISQTGEYNVRIRYAAREAWRDQYFTVQVGAHSISGKVTPTGGWYEYKTFDLGTIAIEKVGPYLVRIKPAGKCSENLMYFQSLELAPAKWPLQVD